MIKEERKIACRLDAQQCQQECEHKEDRTKCFFVTVYPKELYVRCNRIAKNSTAPDKETPDWLETDVRQGAEMGYSLASQQTSELKAENERLRGLVRNYWEADQDFEHNSAKTIRIPTPAASTPAPAKEQFKMPTDERLIDIAVLFNDGKLEPEKLSDMVGMCRFVLDRLFENNDILIPSSKENT